MGPTLGTQLCALLSWPPGIGISQLRITGPKSTALRPTKAEIAFHYCLSQGRYFLINSQESQGYKWANKISRSLILLTVLMLIAMGCTQTPEEVVAPSIQEQRDKANSDDAESTDEVHFHSMARAAVILNVEPNKLGVSGREFRIKRNPAAPGGAFVYDPRDRFQGVERNLVWWVPSGDIEALIAYPLNGPSKLVTPRLEFPGRAGLAEFPSTHDVVAYVFRGEPMP